MIELTVDSEFKRSVPELRPEEFTQLEQNILQDGCLDAIKVWQNGEDYIIIDGHHRHTICQKHNIQYEIELLEFDNRDTVIAWIEEWQLGGRNLTPDQFRYYLGRTYNRKKKTKAEAGSLKGKSKGQNVTSSTAEKIAKDHGVSDRTVKRAGKFAKKVDTVKEEDPEAFEDTILTGQKKFTKYEREKNEKQRKKRLRQTPLPENLYQVIYADPPWQYSNSGFYGSAYSKYETMSTEKICKMNIPEITGEDAICFLWTTNPLLKDALQVMEAWGFDYKTNLVWIKDKSTYGKLGFYIYGQHEILLIGAKGQMQPLGDKPDSIFYGKKAEHSKKPEVAYELIESMYPGLKYLELFARNKREGWTSWGNEI